MVPSNSGIAQDLGHILGTTAEFYSMQYLHRILEELKKTPNPLFVYLLWECPRAACNVFFWDLSWEMHFN